MPQTDEPSWRVLLIGGHSGSGETTVARRLGLDLGVPWMMADDLRLAFVRARASLPSGTDALRFIDTTPDLWRRQLEELCNALIGVGEALSAALEAVITGEAARYNLPVVGPRPWETLAKRITDHLA